MNVVVDTNVAVAANGRNTHASLACQYKCVEFLERLVSPSKRTRIILDEPGLIFAEYSNYLNYKGQPGAGDKYFKYLHDHMYQGRKIRLVPITPIADEARGFSELPNNSVDKSDRKFLATALAAGAAVVNALDSGWHRQADFIADLGVNVQQLCPDQACV